MQHDEILTGTLMDETWLTLDQIAAACCVEPHWIRARVEEGLFGHAEQLSGVWRFSGAELLRARRMRQIERDFDAGPELAALVADMLAEIDEMRMRLSLLNRD